MLEKRAWAIYGLLVLAVVVAGAVLIPKYAVADDPFGGRIGDGPTCYGSPFVYCLNDGVRWAGVGPPRGGKYIWAPGTTDTYEFGPPSGSGQWLLGLYAPPYFCIKRVLPIEICPGTIMTMVGRSK